MLPDDDEDDDDEEEDEEEEEDDDDDEDEEELLLLITGGRYFARLAGVSGVAFVGAKDCTGTAFGEGCCSSVTGLAGATDAIFDTPCGTSSTLPSIAFSPPPSGGRDTSFLASSACACSCICSSSDAICCCCGVMIASAPVSPCVCSACCSASHRCLIERRTAFRASR